MTFDPKEIEKMIAQAEAEILTKLQSAKPRLDELDQETEAMIAEVNMVVDAEHELANQLGRKPTNEEIAKHAGIAENRVEEIREIAKQPIRLK